MLPLSWENVQKLLPSAKCLKFLHLNSFWTFSQLVDNNSYFGIFWNFDWICGGFKRPKNKTKIPIYLQIAWSPYSQLNKFLGPKINVSLPLVDIAITEEVDTAITEGEVATTVGPLMATCREGSMKSWTPLVWTSSAVTVNQLRYLEPTPRPLTS